MRRLLLIGLAVVLLPGCFLFHDDYPDRACAGNGDCFVLQGEECDMATGTCVPAADGGVDATPPPDAPPQPDAAPPPDAQVNDAAVNDASPFDATPFDAP